MINEQNMEIEEGEKRARVEVGGAELPLNLNQKPDPVVSNSIQKNQKLSCLTTPITTIDDEADYVV